LKSPKQKQAFVFGVALTLGVVIFAGRGYFERSFGRSVAQIDFTAASAKNSEIDRDYDETVLATDELSAEAETLDYPTDKKEAVPHLSLATIQKLRDLRVQIRHWAPLCEDGSLTYHECPYQSALHLMGLLCLSGDEQYCSLVKSSQDETGRFWRGPSFINTERENKSSFSTAMARGALAYFAAKSDKAGAKIWFDYIHSHDDRFCPESKDPEKSCKTNASFWSLASILNEWLQWDTQLDKLKTTHFLVERNENASNGTLLPKPYNAGASAEIIYILMNTEKKGLKLRQHNLIQGIARILYQKHPENPLLRFLVRGADEKTAQMILSECPSTKPFPKMVDGWPAYELEFSGKIKDQNAPKVGGHYCIFLINALLGSAN
jgi:hypothetical protein